MHVRIRGLPGKYSAINHQWENYNDALVSFIILLFGTQTPIIFQNYLQIIFRSRYQLPHCFLLNLVHSISTTILTLKKKINNHKTSNMNLMVAGEWKTWVMQYFVKHFYTSGEESTHSEQMWQLHRAQTHLIAFHSQLSYPIPRGCVFSGVHINIIPDSLSNYIKAAQRFFKYSKCLNTFRTYKLPMSLDLWSKNFSATIELKLSLSHSLNIIWCQRH